MNLFDVAIVGGGPAGASLAISLSHHNWSVVMIERSDYNDWRPGEILSAEASPLLSKLGIKIEELLRAVPHIQSQGVVAAWGSTDLSEKHSIFNPYGSPWHIDKNKFDASLAVIAEQAGASVLRKTTCILTTFKDDHWDLVLSDRVGGPFHLMAKFVIDATGRAVQVATKAGARVCFFDELISVIGILRRESQAEASAMNVMTIESTQNGWWYVIPAAGGEVLAAFMTDSEILLNSNQSPAIYWQSMLKNTLHISRLLGKFQLTSKIRIKSARTARLDNMGGSRWLAIGDAAFALDPLSGDGIVRAIESGLGACDPIVASLEKNEYIFDRYSDRLLTTFNTNLVYRRDYYSSERRWTNSVFWHRRHDSLATG
jgi:flavin-dependent dehydrogenase